MILIFDTETTGLPKNWKAPMTEVNNWPRIIQFAYQVVDMQGQLVKQTKQLIKPDGWVIPKEKFWIDNGYSTEKNQAEGIRLPDLLDEFISDYEMCSVIAAHNISFDHNVTGAEMIRYQKKVSKKLPQICTMRSTTNLCKIPGSYGFKFPKLEELHHFLFEEGFDGAHDAMADVNACRRCLFELINRNIITINT